MDQFVCVRLVRAENLDLTLFRFDPDLAFAVFFMNADKTLYGRFGSRSDFHEAERDISVEGLQKAMRDALQLHRNVNQWRQVLTAKRGPEPKYKSLSDYPTKSSGFSRVTYGEGGHCIHCHDLRTAEQLAYRRTGKPMPEDVLFAWPMPDVVGLSLDPAEKATVRRVTEGSLAERAGFQVGDVIEKLEGQPILSIADVQWVLQTAADEDTLTAGVHRGGASLSIELALSKGWRRNMDISWRTTTRRLRGWLLGGIEYRDLSPGERDSHGLKHDVIALRAASGVSRGAGTPIRRDDIIVAVEGSDRYMSEGNLIAYLVQEKKPGEEVVVTVLRDGQCLDVKFRVN